MFKKHEHMKVKGYTYAYWVGNITDRHSRSDYFTFVASFLVTQKSKKQNVVAWSTTKVEYRGMTHGICELLQLRILLTDWIQTKRSNDTLL